MNLVDQLRQKGVQAYLFQGKGKGKEELQAGLLQGKYLIAKNMLDEG
jgi:hypothetical protein